MSDKYLSRTYTYRIIERLIVFLFLDTLSTSLAVLKPFPLPPTSEPTLEVAEFESTSEKDVHPYTIYINHLYVYPQTLCFDAQKIFTRARNIACIVELRDDDSENAMPLRVRVFFFLVN